MTNTCADCLFYCGKNECHRYPPRIVCDVSTKYEDGTESIETYRYDDWPKVEHDDWCGEYQFKERIPND